MALFDISDLRHRAFLGFVPVSEIDLEPRQVPTRSGVYVIVRESAEPPRFLRESSAGRWKGKDPTVSEARLGAEWVDGARTLYIGKADSLRCRIGLLVGFARGEPIMHWGGRLLWQVEKWEALLVAWKVESYFAALESDLLVEFIEEFGRLPFANLKRGDRAPRRPPP